jgi:hypothetical protein
MNALHPQSVVTQGQMMQAGAPPGYAPTQQQRFAMLQQQQQQQLAAQQQQQQHPAMQSHQMQQQHAHLQHQQQLNINSSSNNTKLNWRNSSKLRLRVLVRDSRYKGRSDRVRLQKWAKVGIWVMVWSTGTSMR